MAVDWSSRNQSGNQAAPSDTPSSATGGGWAPAIAQAVKAALDALNAKGQTPSDTSNTASGPSQTNQSSSQSQSQSQSQSSQPPRPDPNTVRALNAARQIVSTVNPQEKITRIRTLLLPVWKNLSPQIRAMIAHSLGLSEAQISAMAAVPLRASLYTPEVPAQEMPGATPAREIPAENAPGTLRG